MVPALKTEGSCCWFRIDAAKGHKVTTHKLSLSLLAAFFGKTMQFIKITDNVQLAYDQVSVKNLLRSLRLFTSSTPSSSTVPPRYSAIILANVCSTSRDMLSPSPQM